MAERVVHPSHYNTGKIEVIEAINDWGLDFNLGNVVKYIARSGHKDGEDPLEALKKAQYYLDDTIDRIEKERKKSKAPSREKIEKAFEEAFPDKEKYRYAIACNKFDLKSFKEYEIKRDKYTSTQDAKNEVK